MTALEYFQAHPWRLVSLLLVILNVLIWSGALRLALLMWGIL